MKSLVFVSVSLAGCALSKPSNKGSKPRPGAALRITRVLILAVLVTALITNVGRLQADEVEPPASHDWDYGSEHGPQQWADLKAEYASCNTGHRQSPIDIQKTDKAALPPIVFDYKPSSLRIIDNGHTIVATYDAGSSIRVGDTKYQLKQFHFHRPSEDTIRGKAYDMEAHLVHADAEGHLAVVAVLLERGKENALVRGLWDHIPKEKGKEALVEGATLNADELLPKDRGYYTFEGSLTTPPCSENVTWLVLKRPVPISADEIAVFAGLYPHNARPTQPLHEREVKASR